MRLSSPLGQLAEKDGTIAPLDLLNRAPKAVLRRLSRLVPKGPRPAILMYHRVAEETFDPWGLAVGRANFAEQIHWLKANRTVLPLGTFAARFAKGTLPSDAVALTFDDGYSCSAEVAAPLLEQAEIPATVFIPAALVDRCQPFWWDELRSIVFGFEGHSLDVANQQVVLGRSRVDDDRWSPGAPPMTPRQVAFQRLWTLLHDKPPAELDAAMADLRRQSGVEANGDSPGPMSPAQVRDIASDCIDIGSHALTHPWLSALDSSAKRREIEDSMDHCERLSGRPPTSFAYPYGNFDEESERLVEDSGFDCACTTEGNVVGSKSRQFALPRVQAGNWSADRLRKTLSWL
jgi:peptidoglycan/xylan/chitin deacetylase (PgdA/CDA1 family)